MREEKGKIKNINEVKITFEKLLENSSIPKEDQYKMLESLKISLKNVEVKPLEDRYAGLYYPDENKIEMNSNIEYNSEYWNDTLMHEMMHAATSKSKTMDGKIVPVGIVKYRSSKGGYDFTGSAIDEGATEYFSNKILKENGRGYLKSYPELINITEDLVSLYGEDVLRKAYLGETDLLEQAMIKDGKFFTEFLDISDDYYREVYNNKDLIGYYAKEEPSAQLKYKKMGQFIEDVKNKRKKENPEIIFSESNWASAYVKLLNGKSKDIENIISGQNDISIEEIARAQVNKAMDEIFSSVNLNVDINVLWRESVLSDIDMKQAFNNSNNQEELNSLRRQRELKMSNEQENFNSIERQDLIENIDSAEVLKNIEGKGNLKRREEISKVKSKPLEWLKKLISRFKKEDEVLLLNGAPQAVNLVNSQKEAFLKDIKVDKKELANQQHINIENNQQEINRNDEEMEL